MDTETHAAITMLSDNVTKQNARLTSLSDSSRC
jgi:hypothetical protein